MLQPNGKMKRKISYVLIYAILISMMQPFALTYASAANSKKLYGAGMSFLQSTTVSTKAGIVVSGMGTVIVDGATYEMRSGMPGIGETAGGDVGVATGEGAVTATGEGATTATDSGILIATGAAVSLRYGVSTAFSIGQNGAPVMFSIANGVQSGNCIQFRVINSGSNSFSAWLVDGFTNEPMYQVNGLGGQNIWREAIESSHTYYLLLAGDAGSSGKILISNILDDHGNSFNQATAIALNREQSIETEVGGDVDVLTFNTVAAASTYRIQIDSILGNGGQYALYDRNGKAVSGVSGTVGTSRITKAFTPTPGARYYFRFSSAQTGRRIVVKIIQSTMNYTITYHLNGGKNASGNIKSYISTLSKYTLKNATRSKYTFGGWYTDAACTKRIYNIYGAYRRSLHLYAKWIKVSPKKTSINFLKSKKIKQIKVKWKKQSGVKGYQIVYGTTRSLKKKVKKKTLTKNYLTLNKMKPNKVYYFKVRSYALDSKGKKIYSGYSKVKKVKVRAANPPKKKAAKKKAATKKTTKKKTTKKTTKKKTAR